MVLAIVRAVGGTVGGGGRDEGVVVAVAGTRVVDVEVSSSGVDVVAAAGIVLEVLVVIGGALVVAVDVAGVDGALVVLRTEAVVVVVLIVAVMADVDAVEALVVVVVVIMGVVVLVLLGLCGSTVTLRTAGRKETA